MYRLECDKFKHPRGIPTGPDGGIYVTDVTAHCLFKFNIFRHSQSDSPRAQNNSKFTK